MGGGENTVAQSTRDFEQKELSGNFYKLMSEFGPKVTLLHCETDIRPEYLAVLFPNIESLELFSRASRKVEMDSRFCKDKSKIWRRLTKVTLEVDPGFGHWDKSAEPKHRISAPTVWKGTRTHLSPLPLV